MDLVQICFRRISPCIISACLVVELEFFSILIGPEKSGKTTFLKQMSKVLAPVKEKSAAETEKENAEAVASVRGTLVESIQAVVQAALQQGLDFGNDKVSSSCLIAIVIETLNVFSFHPTSGDC